jgi:hypothetical protein
MSLQTTLGVNNIYIGDKHIYRNKYLTQCSFPKISAAYHQHGQFEQFEGLRK